MPVSTNLPRAGTLILSLGLAFGLMSHPGRLAAQTPVTLDGVMQGGMTMTSPTTGIQFTIPDGFGGGWDPETGGIVLQSEDALFVGLWGWSEGTVEEAYQVAVTYADEARAALETLPVCRAREALEFAPDFVLHRRS